MRFDNVNLNQFFVNIGFVLKIFSKQVKLLNGRCGISNIVFWYLEPKILICITIICLGTGYSVVTQLEMFHFVNSCNMIQIDCSWCDSPPYMNKRFNSRVRFLLSNLMSVRYHRLNGRKWKIKMEYDFSRNENFLYFEIINSFTTFLIFKLQFLS